MSFFPIPIPAFPGLNLTADPGDLGFGGAIDLLDVDLSQAGRVRSRDGYTSFATPTSNEVKFLYPSYPSGAAQVGGNILAAFSNATPLGETRAYSTLGAHTSSGDAVRLWASNNPTTSACLSTARSPYQNVFIANGVDAVKNWNPNGNVFEPASGTAPTGKFLTVWNSRLVNARMSTSGAAGANGTTVAFATAGAGSAWASEYVDLTGAGGADPVTGLVTWGDRLFAFKERRFVYFYSATTNSGGGTDFNYRDVNAGIGCQASQGLCVGPDGIYFVNRRGIYKTSGGEPVLVSRDIDPIFTGSVPASFSSSAMNQAAIDKCLLFWFGERLFFSYPSGSATSNDRTFVYDPAYNAWTLWSIPMSSATSWRVVDKEELFFGTPSGSIHRFGSAYTTDNGTPISGAYQSGFESLAPPRRYIDKYGFGPSRKRIRSWRVKGSGTVTMALAADYGSTVRPKALTLGTSPAVAEDRYDKSIRGAKISYKLSGAGAWTVNDMVAFLADTKGIAENVSADA